jgi:hypothetical protein
MLSRSMMMMCMCMPMGMRTIRHGLKRDTSSP